MPNVAINQGSTPGTTHLITGIAQKIIRILGMFGAMTATGTMQIKSSGGTAITGPITLSTGQPCDMDQATAEGCEGWGESQVGEGIDIVTTTSGFNGVLTYMLVSQET
jgi:hypothetical protein